MDLHNLISRWNKLLFSGSNSEMGHSLEAIDGQKLYCMSVSPSVAYLAHIFDS